MGTQEFFRKLFQYKQAKILCAIFFVILFLGIYAPFFASSKPFVVCFEGKWYFPFFKYLYYSKYYTKKVDLFCNLLMLTLPLMALSFIILKRGFKWAFILIVALQGISFYGLIQKEPSHFFFSSLDLSKSSAYFKLEENLKSKHFQNISFCFAPIGVQHHWEENVLLLTDSSSHLRLGGQSLFASLLFGIRYSLMIALSSTLLAFIVGLLIGATGGFLGKKWDLFLGRLIEVWESIPTLFVILLIISNVQTISSLWVILSLALFSWTSIARLVRLEVLKQKNLPYVDVLRGLGYRAHDILSSHILSKVAPSLIAIAPFALVGAITYEAALSFLGLGDRLSCSIGLLLDEARMTYPMQPELFWPPACCLILILITLTWFGDLSKKVLMGKKSFI